MFYFHTARYIAQRPEGLARLCGDQHHSLNLPEQLKRFAPKLALSDAAFVSFIGGGMCWRKAVLLERGSAGQNGTTAATHAYETKNNAGAYLVGGAEERSPASLWCQCKARRPTQGKAKPRFALCVGAEGGNITTTRSILAVTHLPGSP